MLGVRQEQVLKLLAESEPLTQYAIGQRLQMSKGNAAECLSSLEEQKYVERFEDGQRKPYRLTPLGRMTAEQLLQDPSEASSKRKSPSTRPKDGQTGTTPVTVGDTYVNSGQAAAVGQGRPQHRQYVSPDDHSAADGANRERYIAIRSRAAHGWSFQCTEARRQSRYTFNGAL